MDRGPAWCRYVVIVLLAGLSGSSQVSDADPHRRLTAAERAAATSLTDYALGCLESFSHHPDRTHVGDLYLASLRADPASEVVLEELIDHWTEYAHRSENALIIDQLAELAEANPEATSLVLVVANAYLHEGQPEQARDQLQRLFKQLHWQDARLIRQLTICYHRLGDEREAMRLLRQALREDRLAGDFLVEQTASAFYYAIATDPDSGLTRRRRDTLLQQSFRHALRAAAAPPETWTQEGALALINMFLRANLLADAIRLLDELWYVDLATEDTEVMLADCLEREQKFDAAARIWRRLADDYPYNHHYHYRLSQLYRRAHQPAAAAATLADAYRLTLNPLTAFEAATAYLECEQPLKALEFARLAPATVPETYLVQGHAYRQMGDLTMAEQTLRSAEAAAVAADSDGFPSVSYYLLTAAVKQGLGAPEAAQAALEAAVVVDPANSNANNALGYYLAATGQDLQRAERLVRRAVKAVPDNATYLDSLAYVLHLQGRREDAVATIERALAVSEVDKVGVLDHAGDIYLAAEQPDKAREFWRRALACSGPEEAPGIQLKLQTLTAP